MIQLKYLKIEVSFTQISSVTTFYVDTSLSNPDYGHECDIIS